MLAKLVGPDGQVHAYEIEQNLAERARQHLEPFPSVRVRAASGAYTPLPECDAVYVNAAATGPLPNWMDALRTGGRLLFPLQPDDGGGLMLLVTRTGDCTYDARILSGAMFIPCQGARYEEEPEAIERRHPARSLPRGESPAKKREAGQLSLVCRTSLVAVDGSTPACRQTTVVEKLAPVTTLIAVNEELWQFLRNSSPGLKCGVQLLIGVSVCYHRVSFPSTPSVASAVSWGAKTHSLVILMGSHLWPRSALF